MTDEEKIAADTAKAEADAKAKEDKEKADAEFEAGLEGLSDEEKTAKRAEKEAKDNLDNDIDYDAEIDREIKRGKPDRKIAKVAFKERDKKRKEGGDEGGEDDEVDDADQPLTRREAAVLFESEKKERQATDALVIARTLTANPKAAQLIVEKWKNRSFPPDLSLSEQLEEAYAITFSKKIIGERNEALRALKGKDNVNKDSSTTHREAMPGTQIKIAPQDDAAIKAAGFDFNRTAKRYEKKLSNGDILVKEPAGKTFIVKKAK